MPRSIIGLVGGKGSGKDETARILVQDFGYERHSMADSLKDCLKIIFGLTDDELNDRVLKEKPLDRWPFNSPRQLMQEVGTDLFRNKYPLVWINAWDIRTRNLDRVVVADVRFHDEAAEIRRQGGVIIRVSRPDLLSEDYHQSEIEQEAVQSDYCVVNDGSLDKLSKSVHSIINSSYFMQRFYK